MNSMQEGSKAWIAIACFLAFLAVAAGALGAHALKGKILPDNLEIFEKAVRYHMFHSLALLVFAGLNIGRNWSLGLMLLGIILFSGALYHVSVTETKTLVHVTPFGGVLILLSWLILGAQGLLGVKIHK